MYIADVYVSYVELLHTMKTNCAFNNDKIDLTLNTDKMNGYRDLDPLQYSAGENYFFGNIFNHRSTYVPQIMKGRFIRSHNFSVVCKNGSS